MSLLCKPALDGGPDASVAPHGDILERARGLDDAAWRRLVELYGRLVYFWCRRSGLQAQDAADVSQNVFRSVATNLRRYRHEGGPDAFRGWLRIITRNKLRDHYRLRRHRAQAVGGAGGLRQLLALPAPSAGADDGPRSNETNPVLAEAVGRVRCAVEERSWVAFWQATVDGRMASDIAADLGMTADAVRMAKSRILRRLRDALGPGGQSRGRESCVMPLRFIG
jgi:RNA polymerase sigma-70 factor (ECF subfamily)